MWYSLHLNRAFKNHPFSGILEDSYWNYWVRMRMQVGEWLTQENFCQEATVGNTVQQWATVGNSGQHTVSNSGQQWALTLC